MTPQEKELTQRSQSYHHHELRRMRRAAEAKQLGLDVHEFAMPWPGNQVTTNHNTGSGFWKGAVLASALLTGGLTGGAFLASQLIPKTAVDTPPVIQPPVTPIEKPPTGKINIWDYDIDMQVIPPKAAPE